MITTAISRRQGAGLLLGTTIVAKRVLLKFIRTPQLVVGSLDPDRGEAISAHLDLCPACAEEVRGSVTPPFVSATRWRTTAIISPVSL